MSSFDNFDEDEKERKHAEKWPSYRGRFKPPPRKPGWMNYAEFLEWAERNGKSPRPIGRFETNPPLNPFDRSTKHTQTKGTRTLQDALDNLLTQIRKAQKNEPPTS